MTIAYLGLGANLGDARQTLKDAVVCLAQQHTITVLAKSSVYRTAPIDASATTTSIASSSSKRASPRALLRLCHHIEEQFGRERPYRNAPRTLDLDILLYGASSIDEVDLVVPHPRMTERAFVLVPLVELEPDLNHPQRGRADAFVASVSRSAHRKRSPTCQCIVGAQPRGTRMQPPPLPTQDRLPMSVPPLTVTAPQLRPPHRYIAIEGPIGVGKTTLATLLAERWSMRTLFERPQDNPFLERFYRDTRVTRSPRS